MPRAVFWVSVNGQEITSTLEPILISITITDSDGGKNDALELELDDAAGDIALPPTNVPIEAGIMYETEDGSPLGPPVQFSGKVDKPSSTFARGGGLRMQITAKSADVKGKPKEMKEQHYDKGKLSAAAKKFGQSAGLQVRVAPGIDLERDYWAMQGENFPEWGARIAQELGATFKVRNGEAIFAERSAGQSLGGQALPSVTAEWGVNIISGTMSPQDDRQTWQKFQVRWYDPKKAKWVYENAEARERPGSVGHLNRFPHADKDSAKKRGESNATEADRDRGGGTITIDGEPNAQAEALCQVVGVRPGVDGTYRIATARHQLSRQNGYTTELELKQPTGDAGKDDRGSGGKSDGAGS